jgi:ribonuclease PH
VEVQATAEGSTFSRAELDVLLDLAEAGIRDLTAAQTAAVGPAVGA